MMKRKPILFIIILLILIAVFHSNILNVLSDFLRVQDKLEKADVILVLAGDSNGERVACAVELYKQGYAPKLLMSGGPLGWRLTQPENMRRQAVYFGVPAVNIILQDNSRSTFQDMEFSVIILEKIGAQKIILVTSPYHTRRASAVARKYFNQKGIKVIVYPVQKSEFNKDKWWTRHEDTAAVVWEYASLVMYLLKGKLF